MDKLKLTGRNLGRVFKLRCRHDCVTCKSFAKAKLSSLELKTRPKQLLDYLLLAWLGLTFLNVFKKQEKLIERDGSLHLTSK